MKLKVIYEVHNRIGQTCEEALHDLQPALNEGRIAANEFLVAEAKKLRLKLVSTEIHE